METNEPASGGVASDSEENPNLVDCDWETCEKKHRSKPSYKGGGTVEKSSSYADKWVNADLEPWKRHGSGINASPGLSPQQLLQEYRAETPSAEYAPGASKMTHPEYHTQKHHLLSAKLFTPRSKLKHNIELSGWDINGVPNGACLPTYTIDIVRHDLQCHRGNHPNSLYYDNLDPLLKDLEDVCVRYCVPDESGAATPQQDRLVRALDTLSARTYDMVKAWEWLLRSDAVNERASSNARYNALTTPST